MESRVLILAVLTALFVHIFTGCAWAEGPGAEDRQAANKAFGDYMTALHGDTPDGAYAFLADTLKTELPADQWKAQMAAMNKTTGKSLGHAGITPKWYKDPPGKPPGIYVTYNFESGYENVAKMQEMVALQRMDDGRFLVVGHSKDEGEKRPAVAELLAELRQRPGVTVTEKDGWTVATSEQDKAIWSFTQEGHPAHPAVAKRWPVEEGGQILLKMELTCEAVKEACDGLAAAFSNLNQATIEKSRLPAP